LRWQLFPRRSRGAGKEGRKKAGDKFARNHLSHAQVVTVYVKEAATVEDFLIAACTKRSLNPSEHFVRVKKRRDMPNAKYFVPHRSDLVENYVSIRLSVIETVLKPAA